MLQPPQTHDDVRISATKKGSGKTSYWGRGQTCSYEDKAHRSWNGETKPRPSNASLMANTRSVFKRVFTT